MAARVGTLRKAWRAADTWVPRRPRTAGALLASAAGAVVVGLGVLGDLLYRLPGYTYGIGYAVVLLATLACLVKIGVPSAGRLLALGLLWCFLAVAVPYGFRGAVLDWRGDRVTVTVTEAWKEGESWNVNDDYRCTVEAEGRTFPLKGDAKCDRDTRPGDRFEVLRDPGDLVAPSSSAPRAGFPLLASCTAGALLLMGAVGARSLSRRAAASRTP